MADKVIVKVFEKSGTVHTASHFGRDWDIRVIIAAEANAHLKKQGEPQRFYARYSPQLYAINGRPC